VSAVLLEEIALASAAVAETPARSAKVQRLAACLRALEPREVPVAVAYLSGELPQAPLGVGWAALRDLPPAAERPTLELLGVDAALGRVAALAGPGSQALRRGELADLFGRATEAERRFLTGLLLGDLRQGALEGVMTEAVARAAEVPATEVRRALMLRGDLGSVASAAIAGGRQGLAAFRLEPLRPVKPMLAQTASGLEQALGRVRPAAVEVKLDGARLQVHRLGGEVRAFTRNLADITDRVPEIAEAVRALPVEAIVLDGEAIALGPGGRPRPFQVTMSRLRQQARRRAAARGRPPLPRLLRLPAPRRRGPARPSRPGAAGRARGPRPGRAARRGRRDLRRRRGRAVPRRRARARPRGRDGQGARRPYAAGRRGAGWLKVKRAHTLDLVVLAAEWGHGRRRGRLSNLHLGARDPATGGFLMLGKTFKGMTDELLAWQTERLLALAVREERSTVHVRPELVVEIAFDGVQASSRYPGGVALRFARVKGYRPDKGAEEADTIDAVRALGAELI